VVIGYPSSNLSGLSEKHRDEETSPRVRRPLDEVVSWNRFASVDPASEDGASS